MAYILLHTSSKKTSLQTQAIRLQHELQTIGHTVELSIQTHPLRLLKNTYDIFHILSEKNRLNLIDTPLLWLARFNRMATVVSSYDGYQPPPQHFLNQIQATAIDAFSSTNMVCLKAHKTLVKNKFILPLLPQEMAARIKPKGAELHHLKILSGDFKELLLSPQAFWIEASCLSQAFGSSPVRKQWAQFQKKYPQHRKSILILNHENAVDLIKEQRLAIDLSSLTDSCHFQSWVDLACAHEQFIILNQNQASGYPDFWKHQKNCWICDLSSKEIKTPTDEMLRSSQAFFKKTSHSMKIPIENKINELSRVYAKIMYEKTLTYNQDKVHPV